MLSKINSCENSIRKIMGVPSRFDKNQPGHFGCSYIHVRIQRGGGLGVWPAG